MSTSARHRIVVGVDESAGAAAALRWAVAEAALRGVEVTAVVAWGFLDQHQSILAEQFDPSYGVDDATAALRGFISAAVGTEAAASVGVLATCDLPAQALLDASRSADLLVVGARGLGGFRGLLLGSVSQRCLHHTTVPIAIIREGVERPVTDRIVVGVDGSDGAQRALRWAIEEARRRAAQLDVVTAWQLPYIAMQAPTSHLEPAEFEGDATKVLEEAIAAEDVTGLTSPVRPLAVYGDTAAVLLEQADAADLLVVGTRGHGALKRSILGSVATQVSHHAACPVVVIPASCDGR